MIFPVTLKSNSESDTKSIANEFSQIIEDGMIICLNGNLGVGKTFFIKRVLENFDVKNSNSPTFSIVNEHYGKKKFYHFDFYRINSEMELLDIGIEDYFNDDEAIIFIEWSNLFPKVIPKKHLVLNIEIFDDDSRTFEFRNNE